MEWDRIETIKKAPHMVSLSIRVCDTGFKCVCLYGYIVPTVGYGKIALK